MKLSNIYSRHRDLALHNIYCFSMGIFLYTTTQILNIKDQESIIYKVMVSEAWVFFAFIGLTSFMMTFILNNKSNNTNNKRTRTITIRFERITRYISEQSTKSCITGAATILGVLIAIGLHMVFYNITTAQLFSYILTFFMAFLWWAMFLTLNITPKYIPIGQVH